MLHWYPNGVSFPAAVPAAAWSWEWSGLTSEPQATAIQSLKEPMLTVANSLHSVLPQSLHC